MKNTEGNETNGSGEEKGYALSGDIFSPLGNELCVGTVSVKALAQKQTWCGGGEMEQEDKRAYNWAWVNQWSHFALNGN